MADPNARINKYDVSLLILRIMIGVVFMYHGFPKVFQGGAEGMAGMLETKGIPLPLAAAWAAGITEFFGGLLVAAGFLTRLWSILLTFTMIMAIVLVHNQSFGMGNEPPGMEYNLVLISMLLAVLISGPGKLSVTGLIKGECCGPKAAA